MGDAICGQHGAFRYTWPGKNESVCCVDHAQQLVGVAGAIGLHLQLIPISYRVTDQIPDEFPTCQQKRGEGGGNG